MMIQPGRIPMSETEAGHLDALLEGLGEHVSLSRRDPNESGPILVQTAQGATYEVDDEGSREV